MSGWNSGRRKKRKVKEEEEEQRSHCHNASYHHKLRVKRYPGLPMQGSDIASHVTRHTSHVTCRHAERIWHAWHKRQPQACSRDCYRCPLQPSTSSLRKTHIQSATCNGRLKLHTGHHMSRDLPASASSFTILSKECAGREGDTCR